MDKIQRLIKNALRCKHCGDIIESKTTHDYVTCSCGICSIDGGLDYVRIGFDTEKAGTDNADEIFELLSEYETVDEDDFKKETGEESND